MRTAPQRASFLALNIETREQKTSTVPGEKEEKPGSRLMVDITVDITKSFVLAGEAKQRKRASKNSQPCI